MPAVRQKLHLASCADLRDRLSAGNILSFQWFILSGEVEGQDGAFGLPVYLSPSNKMGGIEMDEPNSSNRIRRLRNLAEEARTHAEAMSDRDSRQTMLRLADSYEDLARRAQSSADENAL